MLYQSVRTRVHRDGSDRLIHFERVQDVEPVLESNKARRGQRQSGDFRHIASIPNVVLERWMNEEGVNYLALPADEFARLIRRKLADPEWRWLRTSE